MIWNDHTHAYASGFAVLETKFAKMMPTRAFLSKKCFQRHEGVRLHVQGSCSLHLSCQVGSVTHDGWPSSLAAKCALVKTQSPSRSILTAPVPRLCAHPLSHASSVFKPATMLTFSTCISPFVLEGSYYMLGSRRISTWWRRCCEISACLRLFFRTCITC